MGVTRFDRAMSNRADSTTGVVVKSKQRKRKRRTVRIGSLGCLGQEMPRNRNNQPASAGFLVDQ